MSISGTPMNTASTTRSTSSGRTSRDSQSAIPTAATGPASQNPYCGAAVGGVGPRPGGPTCVVHERSLRCRPSTNNASAATT